MTTIIKIAAVVISFISAGVAVYSGSNHYMDSVQGYGANLASTCLIITIVCLLVVFLTILYELRK